MLANTLVAEALAPYIVKSSAATILTVFTVDSTDFLWSKFKQPMSTDGVKYR